MKECGRALSELEKLLKSKEDNICGRATRLAGMLHTCNGKPSQNGRLQWVTVDQCSGAICRSAQICSKMGWSPTAWMESSLVADLRVSKITQREAGESVFLAF